MTKLAIVEGEQADLFSYAALSREQEASAREAAADIKTRLRRSAEDIVVIGKRLIEQKANLPHGAFLPWIEAEFGMSRRWAALFMQVAGQYGDKWEIVSHLPATALYALAAPSTPDEVRTATEELLVEGQVVKADDVKRMKKSLESYGRREGDLRETIDKLKAASKEEKRKAAEERKAFQEEARMKARDEVDDQIKNLKADNETLLKRANANFSKAIDEKIDGRDPADWRRVFHFIGTMRRYADDLAEGDPAVALEGHTEEERDQVLGLLDRIADLHRKVRRAI